MLLYIYLAELLFSKDLITAAGLVVGDHDDMF